MANTIAKASLFLSTDAQQMTQGLDKSKKQIEDFADKMKKKKLPAPKIEAPQDSLGEIAGILKGGVYLAAASEALKGLQQAAQFVVQTFLEVGDKIQKTGKAARDLGVDVSGLSALQYAAAAAGVDVETLQGGIAGLKASLASQQAPKLFGAVGLDSSKLKTQGIEEQFTTVAGALAKIQDPIERARQADKLFPNMGKQLADLLPLLSRGEDGIKKFTEEAKKNGLLVTPESVEQMKKFQEASVRLSGIWDGLKQRIVIALLPLVEKGASSIDPLMKAWGELFPILSKGFRDLAYALSYQIDITKLVGGAYLKYFAAPAVNAVASVLQAYEDLFKVVDLLPEKLRPEGFAGAFAAYKGSAKDAKQASDVLDSLGTNLLKTKLGDTKKEFKSFFSWLDNAGKGAGNAVAGAIDQFTLKLIQQINDLEKEIKKSIATIGFTGFESKIFDLQQSGASAQMLEQVKKLAQSAKEVDAAWGTIKVPPFDMWQRQMAGLQTLLDVGRISWTQYAQGISEAGSALVASLGTNTVKLPSALVKDSREAVSAAIHHDIQGQLNKDPAAQIRQALIEQKIIQQQQLSIQGKLLDAFKQFKTNDIVVASF